MAAESEHVKIVATNRRARHEYVIEDTFEAGLELKGAEVKSLRHGECSIAESYARPVGEELFVVDMHIPPYKQASVDVPDPDRRRKLLLRRREIDRLIARCTQKGCTLIPLRVYFKNGWAKVEIALARKRPPADKKQKKIEEAHRRDAAGEMRHRR